MSFSRPKSATNSRSSSLINFKSRYEITPKTIKYSTDGSGRDGYITKSNGGFFKEWCNDFHSKPTSNL
jgi:hypothetical protein